MTEPRESQVWEVLGGVCGDGILVREGCSLDSPKAACRLATCARVRQLELRGDRLHYELVTGIGPESGWVSLKLRDKDLLVPLPEPGVSLAHARVKSLKGKPRGERQQESLQLSAPSRREVAARPTLLASVMADKTEVLAKSPSKVVARRALPAGVLADKTEVLAKLQDKASLLEVPVATWDEWRQRVRDEALGGWRMEARGDYISPPRFLGPDEGEENPVGALGECGDMNCCLYRPDAPRLRPAFAEYCVETIARALPSLEGSTAKLPFSYVSVGSGALYFDWELLERLRSATGVPIARIALVDSQYGGPCHRLEQALAQFQAWFVGANVRRFPCLSAFLAAEREEVQRRGFDRAGGGPPVLPVGRYQVLMQCDAVQVDTDEAVRLEYTRGRVLQPGGLAFSLGNPPERRCFQRRLDGSGVDRLEYAVWQYPGWGEQCRRAEVQPMPILNNFR